jgi:lysozyme family protein
MVQRKIWFAIAAIAIVVASTLTFTVWLQNQSTLFAKPEPVPTRVLYQVAPFNTFSEGNYAATQLLHN